MNNGDGNFFGAIRVSVSENNSSDTENGKSYNIEMLFSDRHPYLSENSEFCIRIFSNTEKGCGIIKLKLTFDFWTRESIVHDAFNMAYGRNPHFAEQPYYHSDGGVQFTSKATTQVIEETGFMKSVSRPGVPQDNQPIESFWKTIKREMPSIRHMRFDEAKQTIVKYIELYYNSVRLHSSIGYQCPNDVYNKLAI